MRNKEARISFKQKGDYLNFLEVYFSYNGKRNLIGVFSNPAEVGYNIDGERSVLSITERVGEIIKDSQVESIVIDAFDSDEKLLDTHNNIVYKLRDKMKRYASLSRVDRIDTLRGARRKR